MRRVFLRRQLFHLDLLKRAACLHLLDELFKIESGDFGIHAGAARQRNFILQRLQIDHG